MALFLLWKKEDILENSLSDFVSFKDNSIWYVLYRIKVFYYVNLLYIFMLLFSHYIFIFNSKFMVFVDINYINECKRAHI